MANIDALKNFAASAVATAPSPATTGTSLVVTAGDGAKFPAPPFNATVWATGATPTTANAEIVRVTAVATDTLTIVRAQEGSAARTVVAGDQIAATITANTLVQAQPGSRIGAYLEDEFMSGNVSNGGQIGSLGWYAPSNVTGVVDATAGHPGAVNVATGTVAATVGYMMLRAGTQHPVFLPTDSFDATFILRLNTNDANSTARFGLCYDPTANPGTDGAWVEKLAADTSWFGVTRASSTQTRSAALRSTDTAYHAFRLRLVSAGVIGFTVDNGAEVTQSANFPALGMIPFFQVVNASTNNANLDVDYFSLRIAGLGR